MTDTNKYFGAMKQVQSVLPVEEQECLFFLLETMKKHIEDGGRESDEQGKRIFVQYFRLYRQYEAHRDDLPFIVSKVLQITPEAFYEEAKAVYGRMKNEEVKS